jgi:hypothetical protein
MSHLLLECHWVFLDGLLKVLIAEGIGKKGVVYDKIKLFGLACFLLPIVPFVVILIDFLFRLLECCFPY